MNAIYEALKKLDPKNDDHWTNEGLPKVDVVKQLSSLFSLTREQITSTAPGFTRENYSKQQEPAAADAPIVATAPAAPIVAPLVMDTVAPAAVQAPVAEPASDEVDAINELKKSLAALRAVEAEKAVLVTEAQKVFAAVRAEGDELEMQIYKLESLQPHRPQNEIQLYLESQKRIRAERAAKVQTVRPDTRAPIDRAMGRARTPGRK